MIIDKVTFLAWFPEPCHDYIRCSVAKCLSVKSRLDGGWGDSPLEFLFVVLDAKLFRFNGIKPGELAPRGTSQMRFASEEGSSHPPRIKRERAVDPKWRSNDE